MSVSEPAQLHDLSFDESDDLPHFCANYVSRFRGGRGFKLEDPTLGNQVEPTRLAMVSSSHANRAPRLAACEATTRPASGV
jgi:hypothetical protein